MDRPRGVRRGAEPRDRGPGCAVYREPVYGAGPTLGVRVCDGDLVHVTPGPEAQGDVRIWRVTPASFVDG